MRISDIKPGGWVRFGDSYDRPELARVESFSYDRSYANGYRFVFQGDDYGLLFERKDFKYSEHVGDLIKKNEVVCEIDGRYMVGKKFSKEDFIKRWEDDDE